MENIRNHKPYCIHHLRQNQSVVRLWWIQNDEIPKREVFYGNLNLGFSVVEQMEGYNGNDW